MLLVLTKNNIYVTYSLVYDGYVHVCIDKECTYVDVF